MKINRPGLPSGEHVNPNEPLDPREQQRIEKGEPFASLISQTEEQASATGTTQLKGPSTTATAGARTALAEIAGSANLSNADEAAVAVRSSARWMIWARLSEKHRSSKRGKQVIERLSEEVASDPFLKAKLLALLNRIKSG